MTTLTRLTMPAMALAMLGTVAGAQAPRTTLEAAKANAAPVVPAAPTQSATTPAAGQALMTGTNADMIGNAGDPAGAQRGAITSSNSNLPAVGTSSSPAGPPLPSTPTARPF